MKGVLITGGAGRIGYNLVEKLIDTNYNVTILDLESKDSLKKLQKFKNQIKIVYGDVEDANLVKDLVKRNDIVIDYAGIMPPLANLNESIANSTNYIGTKNIVDAIKEVNPECILIYMSFISIYGPTENVKRRLFIDAESTYPDDFYSISLIRSEDYIKNNLSKYSIFRMPVVLTNKNYYIKHMALDRRNDFITSSDLNDIIIGIMKSSKVHGNIYNISGFKAKSEEFVEKWYKATGEINIFGRNLYYGEYEDHKDIEKIYKTNYTSETEFFGMLAKQTSKVKRVIRKIINYPKYLIFKSNVQKSSKK